MKKFLSLLLTAVLFGAASCSFGGGDEPGFDENFLYGKWQSGTLFYKYASDHTGLTWDVADDVTEAEGMQFTWKLVNADLTHIYVTQLNEDGTKASVPKAYTVTTLTASTLIYEDDYGTVFSFSKVR